MDLITHGAVGLALGSLTAGPGIIDNPLALGTLIGSVIPDGDVIYQLKGDYTYLKNHRGASHSIVMGGIISLLVSGILWAFFNDFSFWSIFLWTFGGYMLHISLDILNSYGASILWPFNKKRFGTGLLLIFDPVLFLSAGVIFFTNGIRSVGIALSIGFFILYLCLRWLLKRQVYRSLERQFGVEEGQEAIVMPAMLRLFKWDFILYQEKRIITGRVNIMRTDIDVRDYLERSKPEVETMVLDTNIGRFFKEFSGHYHIKWTEDGENHRATITDLRYYVKGSYLHRATALFNTDLEPIYSAFQPYNLKKEIKVPV